MNSAVSAHPSCTCGSVFNSPILSQEIHRKFKLHYPNLLTASFLDCMSLFHDILSDNALLMLQFMVVMVMIRTVSCVVYYLH